MSCSAKRDPNGTWHIQYRWTDWTGTKKKSQKRGFKTKKEAEEWYAHFILQQTSDPTMTLNDFWEIYKADMEKRLRKTTMKQKEYVMKDKVLPYFGNTPINAITAPMIRKWQGEMIDKGFKPTYLKTINNQLSSILNYAVRFYELRSNPCHKAGSMGKSKADERPYWTLEEFQKFSDAIMDKRDSWMAFQIPYLENFNAEKGTHLVNAGGIHYEPFGIYPGTKKDLSELADGDTIAVPNDTTNEARALLLLQDNGIITLKDGAGLEATVNDIAENPHNVKIEELAAEQVARVAPEVAFVVLNGNYALQAGYSVAQDSLAYETSDSEAAKTYVNVIAVKEGNENNPGIQALVKVLKSDDIKKFINDTYDGAVIPFED